MRILIEPHKREWEGQFAKVRGELQQILKGVPILSIEHVGSTSIPGLLAKPVLDIDIVATRDILASARAAMVSAGYTDIGERGVPDRYSFLQPGYDLEGFTGGEGEMGGMRRNTYVILEGSIALKNHRDLKRVLLQHDDLRDEYSEAKKRIAAREVQDGDEYCRGKNEVMLKILQRAGWIEAELDEVRKANE
ncbi:hypothetical protein OIDMADRAFT_174503 [Oidiodendron maius Zn]|uniref:GrpB family protein n=1 Tax=Oidiodendron maius (strain Zn) TaxID=913774 RepID=A0A0C3DZQ0_OIDMZ|nr:hypothetical protein OIDMADRAFT_174503 [Oidiodendron maius Zn]